MKKLLTFALGVVVLAVVTGCAAPEKQAGEKLAAIPPANKVTLSSTLIPKSPADGCGVAARPGYSNSAHIYPGATVNFVLVSGPQPPPASGVTDAKGEVKRFLTYNQTVRATVQSDKLLTSNDFTCTNINIRRPG